MSASSASGQSSTRIELSGTPDQISRIVALIGSSIGEIIFDSRSQPDPRGMVTALIQVRSADLESSIPTRTAAVTVQAVLDVDTDVWPGLPAGPSVEQLEITTTTALRNLPGVQAARSRVISVLPLPAVTAKDESAGP
ncbi:MAG TPA: hypothetical protein VN520_28535 [Streptomyces sp.]|uniref:hypothetical protein n=1 Tax=Streptomyces sp. TaxID=1931 RepID=UPI002C46059F|nr:hypothetical protein [Streptomyces sp.]HWU10272.1 hypothetical protein [Streptomyces sp.]